MRYPTLAAACLSLFATTALADVPRQMTLLLEGQHHSVEPGFNIDNPLVVQEAIARALEEATQAGMRVKPLELDWSELEPRPGVFDLTEATARLETYRSNGWQPLVYLRAIDSDDLTIPFDMKGTEETVSLQQIDVSSPDFIARYTRLLDQVVPLVREHGGFAILVANEPDNFLTPHPALTEQVLTFVQAARAHVHELDDQMAVGVALSNGFDHDDDSDSLRPPQPYHLALIAASDIAVYNIYCQRVAPSEQSASIVTRLQSRIGAAEGRDIVLQELGCPSAGLAGYSESYQRGFFDAAYAAMQDTSIRLSVAFQLVDWSEATIQLYGEAIQPLFAAEPAFRDNPELIFLYLDQLASIGLINAQDGSPKPALTSFLAAVRHSAGEASP